MQARQVNAEPDGKRACSSTPPYKTTRSSDAIRRADSQRIPRDGTEYHLGRDEVTEEEGTTRFWCSTLYESQEQEQDSQADQTDDGGSQASARLVRGGEG